jgi:hypothetical protein
MTRLAVALLVALLAFASPPASGQMIGDPAHDAALVSRALDAALAATRPGSAEQARLAMEDLFRLWHIFRRMDFDARPDDPGFVPDMEQVEGALYAASLAVDGGQPAQAHAKLEAARKLLSAARTRHGLEAKQGDAAPAR